NSTLQPKGEGETWLGSVQRADRDDFSFVPNVYLLGKSITATVTRTFYGGFVAADVQDGGAEKGSVPPAPCQEQGFLQQTSEFSEPVIVTQQCRLTSRGSSSSGTRCSERDNAESPYLCSLRERGRRGEPPRRNRSAERNAENRGHVSGAGADPSREAGDDRRRARAGFAGALAGSRRPAELWRNW